MKHYTCDFCGEAVDADNVGEVYMAASEHARTEHARVLVFRPVPGLHVELCRLCWNTVHMAILEVRRLAREQP